MALVLILLLSSAKSILGDSDFCFFCIFLLVLVRFNFLDIDFRTNFLDFERTTLTTVGVSEIVFEASSLESESQTNTVKTVAKDRESTQFIKYIKNNINFES